MYVTGRLYMSLLYPFFFFTDTATTEIYTLSLHDALPISHAGPQRQHHARVRPVLAPESQAVDLARGRARLRDQVARSEEHTSELQSRLHLVCRLLLEKKNREYSYHAGQWLYALYA